MLFDTDKLFEYLGRYKARCNKVRNPGYEAAIQTVEDIARHVDLLTRQTPQRCGTCEYGIASGCYKPKSMCLPENNYPDYKPGIPLG